jgi:anti-sigma B factor antagonist
MNADATGGSPGLDTRAVTRGSTVDVTVGGDLDMAAAFKFESEVEEVLTAKDVEAVVLDLSHVDFMDSAGLGALLALRERAQELDVDLSISSVSDAVSRVLDVTGLGGVAEP